MNKTKFGLIGKNISYSFSKKYFEAKFELLGLKNCSYDLLDISEIQEVTDIFNRSSKLYFYKKWNKKRL